MKDQCKSKAQLVQELETLRHEFEVVKHHEEQLRLARELSLDAFTISNSRLRGKARKIGVGAQEFLRFAKL